MFIQNTHLTSSFFSSSSSSSSSSSIATTPWDAVWTAVAEWMGVQDEQDLDWILPNRYRFDTCTDLYHDTDMFKTGGCTCTECTPVTDSPTMTPVTSAPITSAPVTSAPITSAPVTSAPITSAPITSAPTTDGPSSASPTTNKPTPIPTFSSTTGEYVKSIFEAGSIATEVGCQLSNGRLLLPTIIIIYNMVLCLTLFPSQTKVNVNKRILDQTTEKWYCGGRAGTEYPGLIVSPSHGKMSIAKKLRIYTHNNCPNCDAVAFILSGRVDSSSVWVEIDSGDLPWRYESAYSRNSRGLLIDASTYESGDSRRTFTEVNMTSNNVAYLEYKVQFTQVRGGDGELGTVQTSEIELPGWKILSEGPVTPQPVTPSPTSANPTTAGPTTAKPSAASPTTSEPSKQPTNKPSTASPTTSEPSKQPTNKPSTASPTTSEPSKQPTMKPVTDSPSMHPTVKPTVTYILCIMFYHMHATEIYIYYTHSCLFFSISCI